MYEMSVCTRCCSTCPPDHVGSLCPACLKIIGSASSGAKGALGCLTLVLGAAISCAIVIHACSDDKDDKSVQPIPIAPDVAQRFAEPEQKSPALAAVPSAPSKADRIDYAQNYEKLCLKAGMDAAVRVEGKSGETLVITYVL